MERAIAAPTKAFFVNMLVKDISLDSSILDLVDNSMDGAKRLKGEGPYTDLLVDLTISGDEFIIKDNCGGIDIETAKNYAFRFGRVSGDTPLEGSLGVFGVGMKRAIFKIGHDVFIKSTTRTHSFTINLNVPEWQSNDELSEWFFPMEVVELDTPPPDQELGTTIRITNLNENVKQVFSSPYFSGNLRKTIGSRHQRYINAQIVIKLNDRTIPGTLLKFGYISRELEPAREKLQLDGVTTTIFAGIGEQVRLQAGWYIFCNGRMIVEHDQTELTGWGESVETAIPKMHYQFARFRGCVYFDSNDSSKLPWNTTKTGIDETSEVYRTTKTRMVSHTRKVIDFLNRVDKELEQPDVSKRILWNLINRADYKSLAEIPQPPQPVQPFTFNDAPPPPLPDYQKVQASILRKDLERLVRCVRARSNKEAVETVVNWYLENQCQDDE